MVVVQVAAQHVSDWWGIDRASRIQNCGSRQIENLRFAGSIGLEAQGQELETRR